jgi:uncharacterized protein
MHVTESAPDVGTGGDIEEVTIEFTSEGARLRGFLVKPAGASRRLPAVIMAHGTSATLQMVAIDYARSFARAGLAALIYDHRGFGISGGEPRQEINPWLQCRGYVDALTFASSRADLDPQRLALWGDSYSGGEVVLVSACDARRGRWSRNVPRSALRFRRPRRASGTWRQSGRP